LDLAVERGNLAMCSQLIEAGADVNYSTVALRTPLLRAVLDRQYSIIELLVKRPEIDVDKGRNKRGAPALWNDVFKRDCRIVELLLNAGGNPDLMEEGEDSQGPAYNGFIPALHVAAGQGMIDIVHVLIQGGANFNLVARKYQTPLANAVYRGHEDAVHCLIQNGADVNL
ncbi:ankyrin repeat-containing domain protein, partial [Diaporthe sp. PMI_573]